MAKKKPTRSKAELLPAQAASLAEHAAQALILAERLGIKKKPVHLPLNRAERAILDHLSVDVKIQKKLKKAEPVVTVAEIGQMIMATGESLLDAEPLVQVTLLLMARHLSEVLQSALTHSDLVVEATAPTPKRAVDSVLQFKITLRGTKPPIWRRIQVEDCTLDKLHEHIQTAMGWTNSHLHQFDIKGERYGDPELLDDGFEDFECVDSTTTLLSDILPKTGKRFAFKYEYDFGDSWEHEVVFEGRVEKQPRSKYPFCVEGERACPPEDCGGVWGYAEFLDAFRDKKHERHHEMRDWIGGRFDPEKFDAAKATKAMVKGLPDWRKDAW